MAKPPVDIIGFPMDLGTDRRGVNMGPSALRIAGIEEKLRDLGYPVNDHGDVPVTMRESLEAGNPKLKYLEEIVRASDLLAGKVKRSLAMNHIPLCIGGDHSLAIGSIAGVASQCREDHVTLGVIWIDAHTDMNDEATTPSGNIHGMPLAVSIGIGDPQLTNLMGFTPKVEARNCAMIGIRKVDSRERDTIRELNLPVYTMADIDKQGVHVVVGEALDRLKKHVGHIHVSFDIDSVDPSVAPGVGTPVAGGLTYRETHLIMEAIAECGCMSSLDIAEVNPILDAANQSAEFAADLVTSAMGKRIL